MIGALTATAMLLSGPTDLETKKVVHSFVTAFISGQQLSQLPHVTSDFQVGFAGIVSERPDIQENLPSIQKALKPCTPSRVIDLDKTPDQNHWFEIWFDCPGAESVEAKRLRLSVIVRDNKVNGAILLIGNMGGVAQ